MKDTVALGLLMLSLVVAGATVDTSTPDNPWRHDPITVAYENKANDRDFGPQVIDTLEYWAVHDDEYGTYEANFTLTQDKEDADILIEFHTVVICGNVIVSPNDEFGGCAPVLNNSASVNQQVVVKVGAYYSDPSTRLVLKHEFGHLLGIEHGEQPTDIMSASIEVDEWEREG